MEKEVKIRLADVADTKELIKLNRNFNLIQASEELVRWKLQNSQEIVVVAEQEDKLVGFACAQVHLSFCYDHLCAQITEMYVEESYRRKGIGTSLLMLIEAYFKDCQVGKIKIITNEANEAALATYEKHHYKKNPDVILTKKS
ncbi:MAG: GNAT family N-acetyltransferase [Turicibacter sp.]